VPHRLNVTAECPLRDMIADTSTIAANPPATVLAPDAHRPSLRVLLARAGQFPRTMRMVRALPASVLVLWLALPGIGSRTMWNDEYATWYAATISPGALAKLLNNVDIVMAPYYVFMRAWVSLFGDTQTSLRMPSLLGMAAAAGLTTVLGERLFNRWVGITAGLLLAMTPSMTRYAQEARGYGLAVAGALLATLLLLRALERPVWSRWVWYGLAMLATGSAHLVALLIVIPHAVAVVSSPRPRPEPRLWRWAIVAGAVGLIFAPFMIKGSTETEAIAWISDNSQVVLAFPTQLAGSGTVAQAVIGLAGLGGVLLWRTRQTTIMTLLCWGIVPVVLSYITFPVLHLFLFRYFLFTLPAWCLLAATAADSCVRWVADRFAELLVVASLAIVVCGVWQLALPGLAQARQSPPEAQPDFRSAAQQITAGLRPGDGVVYAYTVHRDGRIGLDYELRNLPQPRDVLLATPSQQLGTFDAAQCADAVACLDDTPRIWLVVADVTTGDPYQPLPEATATALRSEYYIDNRWAGYHVAVYLLIRNPA
jgi:mannosyltransferase